MQFPFKVQDCRSFDPRAVAIANFLDSADPADYRRVETWLKANSKYADFQVLTLVELFDREVGLRSETTPHPERQQPPG